MPRLTPVDLVGDWGWGLHFSIAWGSFGAIYITLAVFDRKKAR